MVLIKIIATRNTIQTILILLDTLHIISNQKNIFIFKLALALLIFDCFCKSIQIVKFSVNFNKFTSYSIKFIKSTKLFLIKIITTTYQFESILIFIDTLNVPLYQKIIFTIELALVLFIFNCFVKSIQII